jgi:hypothetical protein
MTYAESVLRMRTFYMQHPLAGIGVVWIDPLLPLAETLITLFPAVTLHELAHAFILRVYGYEIRKVGVFFLGPIPAGAFVEPRQRREEDETEGGPGARWRRDLRQPHHSRNSPYGVLLAPLRPEAPEPRGLGTPDQGMGKPSLPLRPAAHALDAEHTFPDLSSREMVSPLLARDLFRLPDERPPPRPLPELLVWPS